MKAARLQGYVLPLPWWACWLAYLSGSLFDRKERRELACSTGWLLNEAEAHNLNGPLYAQGNTGKLDSNNWARRNLMREWRVESEGSRRGRGGGGYWCPSS
jgi:hypothetical protein